MIIGLIIALQVGQGTRCHHHHYLGQCDRGWIWRPALLPCIWAVSGNLPIVPALLEDLVLRLFPCPSHSLRHGPGVDKLGWQVVANPVDNTLPIASCVLSSVVMNGAISYCFKAKGFRFRPCGELTSGLRCAYGPPAPMDRQADTSVAITKYFDHHGARTRGGS